MKCLPLLLALVSCASLSSSRLQLDEALREFEVGCKVKVDYPVEVAPLPVGLDGAIGVCIIWDSGEKQIFIDPKWWEAAGNNARRWMVWHENGHCALGRDHEDKLRANGTPVSVMASRVPENAERIWGIYYEEELCPGAAARLRSMRGI